MISGGLTIQRLLLGMRKHDASDLHIKVGVPPTYRIAGILRPIGTEPITEDEADHLLDPIVPEKKKAIFEERGDLDFAAYNEEGDRFRINMYRSGGHTNAAIRRVKAEIPSYSELHLPPIYGELISRSNDGLLLVVGITGSGKSSTLAAMTEQINQTEACNIITIEDPVEYRFKPKKSIISQREIGIDVPDYRTALRYVVRQDPDVIFIGEMRDHDTVLAAIQAAETGHLVFCTLHTADTMQSFNRMLEFFPREEHGFIRSSLSNTLRAILAQKLVPAVPNFEVGVVPAVEVLINSPIVEEKIRDGEENDLPSIINASGGEGMISFTKSLADLVRKDWIDTKTAMSFAPNRDALDSELKGLEVKASTLVHRIKAPGKH
jgi:twitching motility protein PilT